MNSSETILERLLASHKICQRCAGRTFGRRKNKEKDYTIKMASTLSPGIKNKLVDTSECSLCFGLVDRFLSLLPKIISELNKYEFSTFLLGVNLSRQYSKSDEIFLEEGCTPLLLKYEISRELGLRIEEALKKEVDFQNPELMINLKVKEDGRIGFQLRASSLCILGKYRKLVRTIPQTKWPCSSCRGRGCNRCDYTGQQYKISIESIVSEPFMKYSLASDESFHGAGREDIDARMLGTGRPFVIELKNPHVRTLPLKKIEQEVNQSNMIQISYLQVVPKKIISQIKTSSPDSKKRYLAQVTIKEEIIPEEVINKIESLVFPLQLKQRTPLRVSHRRADLIRDKKIYEVKVLEITSKSMILEILAQGGAYIKEFISGDEGRTNPSISSMINAKCVCTALDVLMVEDHGLFPQQSS